MSKINIFDLKEKIIVVEFIAFSALIVSYLLLQVISHTLNIDIFIITLVSELILALLAGVSAGLVFELFIRREHTDKILSLVNIKDNILRSGFKEYIHEFKDIDFNKKIYKSYSLDFYFAYGLTFVENISQKLEEKMMQKDVTINIYFLSKENPFLHAFGELWGKYNNMYTTENLIDNIQKVQDRF